MKLKKRAKNLLNPFYTRSICKYVSRKLTSQHVNYTNTQMNIFLFYLLVAIIFVIKTLTRTWITLRKLFSWEAEDLSYQHNAYIIISSSLYWSTAGEGPLCRTEVLRRYRVCFKIIIIISQSQSPAQYRPLQRNTRQSGL